MLTRFNNITADKVRSDNDDTLKDGQTLKVRMTMMDSMQQVVAASLTADHVGGDYLSRRPNSAVLSDDQRSSAIARQQAADKRLSDAWRHPTSSFHVPVTAASGRREAISEVTTEDQLDTLQVTNQARYNSRIENAWRNPTNHGEQGC